MKGNDFIKRGPMMVGGSYVDGGPGEDEKKKKEEKSTGVNGADLSSYETTEYGKNKMGDGDYKELKKKRAPRKKLDWGDSNQSKAAFNRKLKGERVKTSRKKSKRPKGLGTGSMFGFGMNKCTGLNCKPKRPQKNLRMKRR